MILPVYEHLQQENRLLREINAEMLAALMAINRWEENGENGLIAFELVVKAIAKAEAE